MAGLSTPLDSNSALVLAAVCQGFHLLDIHRTAHTNGHIMESFLYGGLFILVQS